MKKVLFSSALIAFASVLLVSCKKDRVCECTNNGQVEKVTYNDATKRQAKDACTSYSVEFGGQTYKVECELK